MVTTSARCDLSPITPATADGSFQFSLSIDANVLSSVSTSASLSGLEPAASYTWQVLSKGNLLDRKGALSSIVVAGGSITADANGNAILSVENAEIALNGEKSIVGRAITLTNTASSTIAAQCVIGITAEAPKGNIEVTPRPEIQRAICVLEGTSSNPMTGGVIDIIDNGDSLDFQLLVDSLPPGNHQWHIHELGDISSLDGSATGPHFGLNCNCRSGSLPSDPNTPVPDEAGTVGDGKLLLADKTGVSQGFIRDSVLGLNGLYSIVGRSVIIHDTTSLNNARAAQCVIGLTSEEDIDAQLLSTGTRAVPINLQASAIIESSPLTEQNIRGWVDFSLANTNGDVIVTYYISGLLGDLAAPWHVHLFGDLTGIQGWLAVSGHFIGQPRARAEVGQLNNNQPITPNALGVASGAFLDTEIRLNGVNSVVGRSVVIHSAVDNSRIALGAIGIAKESLKLTSDPSTTRAAICTVESVLGNDPADQISGYVSFENARSNRGDVVQVRYFISGLEPGEHGWHVHKLGNIIDNDDGLSVGGHFIGTPQNRAEVGQLDGNRPIIADENGVARGQFLDDEIKLKGIDSIVGRSVLIHGIIPSERVAQCVIGITSESDQLLPNLPGNAQDDIVPSVLSAQAVLKSVDPDSESFEGVIEFFRDSQESQFPATRGIAVRYAMSGLSPGEHAIHVHEFGDIFDSNGIGLGGHFVGSMPSRTPGVTNEVGNLNDGIPILADANGNAVGSYFDTEIELNGVNSIVGRSVVIHGDRNSQVQYVGIGTIGRVSESSFRTLDQPLVTAAGCVLENTTSGDALNGWVGFMLRNFAVGEDETMSAVEVMLHIGGLTPGLHPWHVHEAGNILSESGSSPGEHFIGESPQRPSFIPNEVGQINDGKPLIADSNGFSYDVFLDSQIALNGPHSIVGRSIVIHESDGSRSGQCVIGIVQSPDQVSQVEAEVGALEQRMTTNAVCVMRDTVNADSDISGQFTFTDTGNGLAVSYEINGLSDGEHTYHIHELGRALSIDGSAVLGHFLGDPELSARSNGMDGVGYLNNGAPISSENGLSNGEFNDPVATLYGANSIIGRSIILHGNRDDPGARVAQCVIGINEDENDAALETVLEMPVTRGMCVVENLESAQPISGFVEFEARMDGDMNVRMILSGLNPGEHKYYVHDMGNIGSPDGSSTGSRFSGTCDNCRRFSVPQEVGTLNEGIPVVADENGFVRAKFVERMAVLHGENSITGRSIVFRENSLVRTTRVANCVVGRSETNTLGQVGPTGTGFPAWAIAVATIGGVAVLAGMAVIGVRVKKRREQLGGWEEDDRNVFNDDSPFFSPRR